MNKMLMSVGLALRACRRWPAAGPGANAGRPDRTGHVGRGEGPMEGVLVSARRPAPPSPRRRQRRAGQLQLSRRQARARAIFRCVLGGRIRSRPAAMRGRGRAASRDTGLSCARPKICSARRRSRQTFQLPTSRRTRCWAAWAATRSSGWRARPTSRTISSTSRCRASQGYVNQSIPAASRLRCGRRGERRMEEREDQRVQGLSRHGRLSRRRQSELGPRWS